MQKLTLVACIFNDASSAIDVIHELRGTGFSDDQLGLVVRYDADGHGTNALAREIISGLLGAAGMPLLPASETNIPIKHNEPVTVVKAEQNKRGTGIIVSGVIGGTLGTIAILDLPEIGQIVVGGLLIAILGNATPGGIAANFLHMGMPAQNAHYYEQKFQAGCIIFTIKAIEQQQEVQDILHYHRAHSIEVH